MGSAEAALDGGLKTDAWIGSVIVGSVTEISRDAEGSRPGVDLIQTFSGSVPAFHRTPL
jgi:hypothetical protein